MQIYSILNYSIFHFFVKICQRAELAEILTRAVILQYVLYYFFV